MRALTLTQPWASLVAIGAKQIETRSWSTSFRGEIAIHAAKRWSWDDETLCYYDPFRTALIDGGFLTIRDEIDTELSMTLGAIVAVVTLVDCRRTEGLRLTMNREIRDQELAFGNYEHGRYGWLLANVRRLPEPIPCRGALGLWTVPAEIEQQIEAQLAEVSVA